MNSAIIFTEKEMFLCAVTALELDATPVYDLDVDNLSIHSDDIDGVVDVLHNNGFYNFSVDRGDEESREDNFRDDVEADADALRSAGFDDEENYCSSYDSFGED